MEDSKQSEALSLEQFKQIVDKLSRVKNKCKSILETWHPKFQSSDTKWNKNLMEWKSPWET